MLQYIAISNVSQVYCIVLQQYILQYIDTVVWEKFAIKKNCLQPAGMKFNT